MLLETISSNSYFFNFIQFLNFSSYSWKMFFSKNSIIDLWNLSWVKLGRISFSFRTKHFPNVISLCSYHFLNDFWKLECQFTKFQRTFENFWVLLSPEIRAYEFIIFFGFWSMESALLKESQEGNMDKLQNMLKSFQANCKSI